MIFEEYESKIALIAEKLEMELVRLTFPNSEGEIEQEEINFFVAELESLECSHFIKVDKKYKKIQLYTTKKELTENETILLKEWMVQTKKYMKTMKIKNMF
jgi:hypothetical protein